MAKVDIGTESYDAFIDVDRASVYLAGDILRATNWALANDDAKARALVSATRLLLGLPWREQPAFVATPDVVQQVTAMLAADLLAEPELFSDASGSSNVKSVRAGSASVEFFRPVEGGPLIPAALWRMLVAAGLVATATGDGDVTAGALVTGLNSPHRPYCGRYSDNREPRLGSGL
jgi:hypothetical protein